MKKLIGIILASSLCGSTNTCLSGGFWPNAIVLKAQGANATVYATYQFLDQWGNPAKPNPAVRQAVKRAANEWNALHVGVKFVEHPFPSPPDLQPDIRLQFGSPDNAVGCAAYYRSQTLIYSPRFVRAAAANPPAAAFIIAHEFGHALRLPEAGPNAAIPTVMNNPRNIEDPLLDADFCMAPKVRTMTVTQSDAVTARDCYVRGQLPSGIHLVKETESPFTISQDNCLYRTGVYEVVENGRRVRRSFVIDVVCVPQEHADN
jgi:hypothetical protein